MAEFGTGGRDPGAHPCPEGHGNGSPGRRAKLPWEWLSGISHIIVSLASMMHTGEEVRGRPRDNSPSSDLHLDTAFQWRALVPPPKPRSEDPRSPGCIWRKALC